MTRHFLTAMFTNGTIFPNLIRRIGLSDRRALIIFHDVMMALIAMRLALFVTLDGTDSVLTTEFFVKQSFVLGLISVSIFMFLQTYRGVWRFFTARQAVLLAIATAIISVIYWPLLTTASLSPVEIPRVTIGWFYGIFLGFLIGSRVISKILRYQAIAQDASAQLLAPAYRVVLIGNKDQVKTFKTRYQALKTDRYEVLGVVTTDKSTSDESLMDSLQPNLDRQDDPETYSDYSLLGTVDEIKDIFDNLCSEDFQPHQFILLDAQDTGSVAPFVVNALVKEHISFGVMRSDLPLKIDAMTMADVYASKVPTLDTLAFHNKTVLVYGAASDLGKEITKSLMPLNVGRVIMWDHDVVGLENAYHDLLSVKHPAVHKASVASKLVFETRMFPSPKSLERFLTQNAVDIIINLRGMSAISASHIDSMAPFEIGLQENMRLSQVAKQCGVSTYGFVSHEVPHQPTLNSLSLLMNDMILDVCGSQDHKKEAGAASYFSVHTPFIVSKGTLQFMASKEITISQDDVAVCTPQYGAYMVLQSFARMIDAQDESVAETRDEPEFSFEIISYETLLADYGALYKTSFLPKLMKVKGGHDMVWPESTSAQEALQAALKARNVNEIKSILTAS